MNASENFFESIKISVCVCWSDTGDNGTPLLPIDMFELGPV